MVSLKTLAFRHFGGSESSGMGVFKFGSWGQLLKIVHRFESGWAAQVGTTYTKDSDGGRDPALVWMSRPVLNSVIRFQIL